MKKIILLFLLLCSGLLNAQISLSEIQDTVGKGYVPITDYDPALATYIQKYMLLQDYLRDSIDWGIGTLDLNQVLTNGNDAGGLDAINFAEVEADEFIGDLRGAVLFKAQAGEALSKGDVVYVSGISGNTTIVSKADADDATKMPAFGVVAAAASLNNPVDIYTFGTLSNLNTSAYTLGDVLYVSTTAGQLTATPPTGESALLQNIAKVTRVDNSAGSIKISGAGRTNATPNLNTGRLFVGNASNQAVADGTVYVDIANSRVGIGTSSPSQKLEVAGNIHTSNNGANNFVRGYYNTGAWSELTGLGLQTDGAMSIYSNNQRVNPIYIGLPNLEWTNIVHYFSGGVSWYDSDGVLSSLVATLNSSGLDLVTVPTENTDNILTYGSTGLVSQRTLADITAEIVADPSLDLEQVLTNDNDAGGQAANNFSTISIGTTTETGYSLYLRETNPNIGFYDTDITSPTNNISGNAGHLAYNVDPTNLGSYFHLWYGNGSEIMRLTDTGNLGIGLTNPDRMLEITNTGSAYEAALEINSNSDAANWARLDLTNVNAPTGGFIFYQDNGGKAGIRNLSTDRITYVVDNSSAFHAWEVGVGTEKMRLNSTGLGIGTNSPTELLDVQGSGSATINIRDNSDVTTKLRMRGNSGNDLIDYRLEIDAVGDSYTWHDRGANTTTHYDDVDTYIWRNNAGTEQMRKNSSGDFGVGVNPNKKLHVKDDSEPVALWVESDYTTGGLVYSSIEVGSALANGQTSVFGHVYDSVTLNDSYAHITPRGLVAGTSFKVERGGDVILAENSGYSVGIATTTPTWKLDVSTGANASESYFGRNIVTDGIRVLSTSGRTGFVAEVANAYSTTGDESLYYAMFPFDSGHNGYAYRTSVGTTLVDKFWTDYQGNGYFAGNLGIGLTTPSKQLTIQSTGNAESLIETTIDALAATTLKNADAQWRIGVESFDDGLIFRQQDAGYTVGEALKLGADLDVRVYNNLRVDAMTQDDTESQIVVWDSGTNNLRWRDVSTIGGGDGDGIYDGSGSLSSSTTVTINGYGIDFVGSTDEFSINSFGQTSWTEGSNSSSIFQSGTGFYIQNATSLGSIQLRTGNPSPSTALYVKYDGNIGIGTLNPDKLLVVEGANSEIVINDTSNSPELSFENSGATSGSITMTSNQHMRFLTGGTSEQMRITDAGLIGINITSPNAQLDVGGRIESTNHIVSGVGSGGVAMTINDGKGNANLTFNHTAGVPEQAGAAARIEVNTDATTNAYMYFELKENNATSSINLVNALTLFQDNAISTTSAYAAVNDNTPNHPFTVTWNGSQYFRVETDGDLSLAHNGGGTVSIGHISPDATKVLDVEGDSEFNGDVEWEDGALGTAGNGTTSGAQSGEYRIRFSSVASGDVTIDGDITYSDANDEFTVTNAGKYRISYSWYGYGTGTNECQAYVKINNTIQDAKFPKIISGATSGSDLFTYSVTFTLDISAGHTVDMYQNAVTNTCSCANAYLEVERLIGY